MNFERVVSKLMNSFPSSVIDQIMRLGRTYYVKDLSYFSRKEEARIMGKVKYRTITGRVKKVKRGGKIYLKPVEFPTLVALIDGSDVRLISWVR